ncbi:transposase [Xanthobacter autotrophicus]|uniref:transposase n=1 Tax=Xanthobacter autotrophicus TaxID=280 RepID=UPI00372A8D71
MLRCPLWSGRAAGGRSHHGKQSPDLSITHKICGEPVRRFEVFTGARRSREWAPEEKARIVAESFEPEATGSAVARRHALVAAVAVHLALGGAQDERDGPGVRADGGRAESGFHLGAVGPMTKPEVTLSATSRRCHRGRRRWG